MATFWVENNKLYARDLIPGSLEDSLAKWEHLFNRCVAGELVHGGGCSTCSLCLKYITAKLDYDCVGCPIWAYTGLLDCCDTPYEDYYEAVKRGDIAMAMSAAEEMMLFLEKLLSEGLYG